MIPLTLAREGEELTIGRVGGGSDTKRFLESLGFVAGTEVSVVSEMGGNVIVKIKDSRVAVSKEMASKLIVNGC